MLLSVSMGSIYIHREAFLDLLNMKAPRGRHFSSAPSKPKKGSKASIEVPWVLPNLRIIRFDLPEVRRGNVPVFSFLLY